MVCSAENSGSLQECGPPFTHRLKEYTLGVNYNFNQTGTKIQLNYIIDDTERGGFAFFGTRRQLFLGNYQVAW